MFSGGYPNYVLQFIQRIQRYADQAGINIGVHQIAVFVNEMTDYISGGSLDRKSVV